MSKPLLFILLVLMWPSICKELGFLVGFDFMDNLCKGLLHFFTHSVFLHSRSFVVQELSALAPFEARIPFKDIHPHHFISLSGTLIILRLLSRLLVLYLHR